MYHIHEFEDNKTATRVGGFTIVETLVAVTILLVVIIGPLTIASQGLSNAMFANEQTTAVFLAQEAIEAVQELRDTVALNEFEAFMENEAEGGSHSGNSNSWYEDLPEACKEEEGCDVDMDDNPAVNANDFNGCSEGSRCVIEQSTGSQGGGNLYPLYANNVNGESLQTPFTRKITLDPIMDGGIQVGVFTTVEVSWTVPVLGAKVVVLQSAVYDQYQRYE